MSNKKNRGIIPQVEDPRVLLVPIGCGKCVECLKKKANEWRVRLHEELKERTGLFVTLTFSDEALVDLEKDLNGKGFSLEGYDLDNECARLAVQRFSDRWKNAKKKRPRRWFVTEIGGTRTERIHLHGILFESVGLQELTDLWKYGNVWIGDYCDGSSINYIVKYLHKPDLEHKEYTPRVFTSYGMGAGYAKSYNAKVNKYKPGETREYYRLPNGGRTGLPIYYRNKIYSEEEREKLWIEKLDKEVRFVMGKEIDISKGEDEYWSVLKEARRDNKKWGFGDNSINWDRKLYERQRRRLKKIARLKKVKKVRFGESGK